MPDREPQMLLRFSPLPLPDTTSLSPAAAARFDTEVRPLWTRYIQRHVADRPDAEPSDYETFVEQLMRLRAVLEYRAPEQVWLYWPHGDARNLVSGERQPKLALLEAGALEYGVIHKVETDSTAATRQNDLAGDYASSRTFQAHAGREIILAAYAAAPGVPDLVASLQSMRARGIERAFVKTTIPKYGAGFIDLYSAEPEVIREALFECFDWTLVHLEGRRDAFIAQSAVEMCYEYRFFVVHNTVVTGAGCIEEYTPLDGTATFDPQVRKFRAHPTEKPVVDEELVQQYLRFAQDVVHQLAVEQPELHTYVLDVAMTGGGPCIVELNGLPNAGLYASDPARVVEALLLA